MWCNTITDILKPPGFDSRFWNIYAWMLLLFLLNKCFSLCPCSEIVCTVWFFQNCYLDTIVCWWCLCSEVHCINGMSVSVNSWWLWLVWASLHPEIFIFLSASCFRRTWYLYLPVVDYVLQLNRHCCDFRVMLLDSGLWPKPSPLGEVSSCDTGPSSVLLRHLCCL